MASKIADSKKAALRQLMKQEKQKKIDSPLAKYTNSGQLYCALCGQQLTSETFWKAHVNGRDHKQKLAELKSNIKQPATDAVFAKPFPPSPVTQQRGVKRSHDVVIANDRVTVSKAASSITSQSSSANTHSALPADFFDSGSSKSTSDDSKTTTKPVLTSTAVAAIPTPEETTSVIPEGFFDDPQMDARVRKVEYVDKMEVAWDAFTREMKQETHVSEKMEASDDLDRVVEREINETTDLISRWQKIEDMHNRKDSRLKVKTAQPKVTTNQASEEDDDNDDEESLEKELQSMFNWRQKRS